MRLAAVYERLRAQRSVLTTVNGALDAAGEKPIEAKPLDNHLAWIARALGVPAAA